MRALALPMGEASGDKPAGNVVLRAQAAGSCQGRGLAGAGSHPRPPIRSGRLPSGLGQDTPDPESTGVTTWRLALVAGDHSVEGVVGAEQAGRTSSLSERV